MKFLVLIAMVMACSCRYVVWPFINRKAFSGWYDTQWSTINAYPVDQCVLTRFVDVASASNVYTKFTCSQDKHVLNYTSYFGDDTCGTIASPTLSDESDCHAPGYNYPNGQWSFPRSGQLRMNAPDPVYAQQKLGEIFTFQCDAALSPDGWFAYKLDSDNLCGTITRNQYELFHVATDVCIEAFGQLNGQTDVGGYAMAISNCEGTFSYASLNLYNDSTCDTRTVIAFERTSTTGCQGYTAMDQYYRLSYNTGIAVYSQYDSCGKTLSPTMGPLPAGQTHRPVVSPTKYPSTYYPTIPTAAGLPTCKPGHKYWGCVGPDESKAGSTSVITVLTLGIIMTIFC